MAAHYNCNNMHWDCYRYYCTALLNPERTWRQVLFAGINKALCTSLRLQFLYRALQFPPFSPNSMDRWYLSTLLPSVISAFLGLETEEELYVKRKIRQEAIAIPNYVTLPWFFPPLGSFTDIINLHHLGSTYVRYHQLLLLVWLHY